MIAPLTVLFDHTVLAELPPCPDPRGPDGVLEVSADRWATAQRYEDHCWLTKYRHLKDDRERVHADALDGYRVLAGRHYRRAIEVGCGPFTQILRILRGSVEVDSLTLLDPLLDRYAELPNCTHGYLARGRTLTRVALPLEAWAIPAEGYDLIVAINVLQHCRSYSACLDAVRSMATKGSTLVLGEACVKRADLDEVLLKIWDAGHPLMFADDRYATDVEAMGRVVYRRAIDSVEYPWRKDLYCIAETK